MKTILLIDDTIENLENTKEILELENFRVITASNGKEGLKKALQLKPDLIISDIMMPEMDGYTFLQEINKYAFIRVIPFIFLTAKSKKADYKRGMDMGADDFLVKPFEIADLLATIEHCLTRQTVISQNHLQDQHELSDLILQRRSKMVEILSEDYLADSNQYQR